jgi:His/Glu/Gln/Arg/opine family amino acid ABC transporter permease subunit
MLIAYQINWTPVLDHKHALLVGRGWTSGSGDLLLLACLLGVALALFRTSGFRLLSWPAFVYIQLVRGVPLLVFLYWVYFGLAIITGVAFTGTQAAIILHRDRLGGTAEIFRAAFLEGRPRPGKPPRRSASRRASFRHVLFPQAFRIALPPLGNHADRAAEARR